MIAFTERKTVQNPILRYATEIGWEFLDPDKAIDLRDGETGILFDEILKEKLFQLNPWIDEETIEEIIKDIEQRTRADLLGNQKIVNYLRGTTPFYSKTQKQELNVKFLDFENPESNIFQMTSELGFTNGKIYNRFDLVFYINGIPIVIAETKTPEKEEGISEALTQIHRYHRESFEFLKVPPIFVASNLLEFHYGGTWNFEAKNLYIWRDGENFEELVKTFFNKRKILSFLEDYIIFWIAQGELKKILLNFHQIRAVERIIKRVLENKKKSGLIWHTQGSGKTLTMIVSAHKLRKISQLENPTLIAVVDRNELEEQFLRNLENYGFPIIEEAKSKGYLQMLLKQDFRGLILTTVHKFEKMPANINNRENVIIFVDEAHRSQEGELATYMRAALPNAFFFGFTGTPVDKTNIGKGTFLTFGKEDRPQGYLDKYSILDSLKDWTTVPIYYTLAPNELLTPTDVLEKEFFKMIEEEAIVDLEGLDKKILQKAVKLKNLLKSDDRVAKIAQFVAKHFKENIEPMGFKAILVGVDREACAFLKQKLDNYLPSEYSQVVYTPDYRDPEFMKKYYLSEEEEKNIKKNFLKIEETPKILIVTSKLLTGFDAPILYVMYLDKPMSDHTLLQAIARVNRPFSGGEKINPKTSGLIIDFIGVFEKLEKALRFDSVNIEGVVVDFKQIKKEFKKLIEKGQEYINISGRKIDDKAIERIIDHFTDKEKRKDFIKFYREIEKQYEILSPDPFLRSYLEDYFILSGIFKVIKTNFGPKIPFLIWQKTAQLIRAKTQTVGLRETLPLYPIDERTIKIIHEDSSPERVKIIKIHRSITILIDTERSKQPFLFSLKEKLERILEEFEQRQATTKETLEKLKSLINEINVAKQEKDKLKLSPNQFGVYWTLKDIISEREKNKQIATKIGSLINEYSNWMFNNETARTLKRHIIKELLPICSQPEEGIQKMKEILDMHRYTCQLK
ncbi:MAG: HsdR family type I site-specific deoxyribonuclease [Patescibacteria group bacterium]|nr:HsdR family type I site-specific deoxyribonuclease [Patescibacteria group bacterium]